MHKTFALLAAAAVLIAPTGQARVLRENRVGFQPATVILQADPAPIAQRLLAAHNRERAALGLPPLTWSASLADEARQWSQVLASKNEFAHAPDAVRHEHGENLFMGTAGAYAPEAMIGDFISEKADFRPGRFPDVARDGEWENVGHYTQLIWRGTTEVGCAVVSAKGWDYLTCRYAPAGNVIGEAVF